MNASFGKKILTKILFFSLLMLFFSTLSCTKKVENVHIFSFDVTCDTRGYTGMDYDSLHYFRGACEAINKYGKGRFMVSPGDIDPPADAYYTIKKALGNDYHWYPVIGNHEAETPSDMEWLRDWGRKKIPGLVQKGPANCEETTYSFAYENTHFIILNQYYDGLSDIGTNGDVGDSLYTWLAHDLAGNTKPNIIIFGHEPIVSIPDSDNGRHRHKGDNLDAHPENSHRFQTLLREHNVTAYICGHTHNFSATKINGLWQIDAGHARGKGDLGSKSTFLKINIGSLYCSVDVYRSDGECIDYALIQTIILD